MISEQSVTKKLDQYKLYRRLQQDELQLAG